jgi:hypothetical protein
MTRGATLIIGKNFKKLQARRIAAADMHPGF